MTSSLPPDEEMAVFQKELEEMGPSEAWRKLNQGKYGPGWKHDEINRFLSEKSSSREESYKQILLNFEKERALLSKLALAISIFAMITALFKDQIIALISSFLTN